MGINVLPIVSSAATAAGAQTFKSSSTWTAPAGVTAVNCMVVGAGGGGGSANNTTSNTTYNFPAGGGAGGLVSTESIAVTPGTTYTVIVGSGGAGGTATSNTFSTAKAGGYSSFALNSTLQNGILNGAVELQLNNWWMGDAPSYGTGSSSPIFPSEYNGAPYDYVATYTNFNISPAITNIPVNSSGATPFWYNNRSNSGYKDLITWVAVKPSTPYIFSAYVVGMPGSSGGGSGGYSTNIRVDWYTAIDGSSLSAINSGDVYVTNTTTRRSVTGTSPSNATYALVRLQTSGNYPIWTGAMVQEGSTLNNYQGVNTSASNKLVPGLGVITVNSGLISNGGGGGAGQNSSTRKEGDGFGGGQSSNQGGSYALGGNGAGAGISSGAFAIFASSASMPYIGSLSTINNSGGGYPSGSPSVYLNSSTGGYLQQPDGNPGINGYGAGGMGGRHYNVFAGIPGIGAGIPAVTGNIGISGAANTGAGGGGAVSSTSSTPAGFNGGNGGSGIVTLSW